MTFTHLTPEQDKAIGALYGLALGDALGMPAQTMPKADIVQHYGTIEGFITPFDGHPVAHGLLAAQVTDDTEQTVLLAQRLLKDPTHFSPTAWAQDLLDWEADVRERGLLDLLGPSSKAALEAIGQGIDPAEAAKNGTTNGAAMRIVPVGILYSASDLVTLVDAVEETCRVTHNTGEAIAAASAVAAFVSACIEGRSPAEGLTLACEAAELGQRRGYPNGAPDIATRITKAIELGQSGISLNDFADQVGSTVASSESVPAAFGLMLLAQYDTWQAGLLAANIGEDTDTIGAIACAMCAATAGASCLPEDKLQTLLAANSLDMEHLGQALLAQRQHAPDFRKAAGS